MCFKKIKFENLKQNVFQLNIFFDLKQKVCQF